MLKLLLQALRPSTKLLLPGATMLSLLTHTRHPPKPRSDHALLASLPSYFQLSTLSTGENLSPILKFPQSVEDLSYHSHPQNTSTDRTIRFPSHIPDPSSVQNPWKTSCSKMLLSPPAPTKSFTPPLWSVRIQTYWVHYLCPHIHSPFCHLSNLLPPTLSSISFPWIFQRHLTRSNTTFLCQKCSLPTSQITCQTG